MKALVIALAVLALAASPVMAYQCPVLIQQLKDAVAKMSPTDPKAAQVQGLIAEAQKLHEEGKHAESVAKAQEAAKVLGP